jgi:uncharacterized membrane protein
MDKGFWASVGTGLLIGAISLAGLWGGRSDRFEPATVQGAIYAFLLWSACTVAVVAIRRALAARKRRQNASQ